MILHVRFRFRNFSLGARPGRSQHLGVEHQQRRAGGEQRLAALLHAVDRGLAHAQLCGHALVRQAAVVAQVLHHAEPVDAVAEAVGAHAHFPQAQPEDTRHHRSSRCGGKGSCSTLIRVVGSMTRIWMCGLIASHTTFSKTLRGQSSKHVANVSTISRSMPIAALFSVWNHAPRPLMPTTISDPKGPNRRSAVARRPPRITPPSPAPAAPT